jgi:hypothetical protein
LLNGNKIGRFAGSGVRGNITDGGNSSAIFCGATQCTADRFGNIYIGEDCSAIRVVNQTGYVSTLASKLTGKPFGFTFNGTSDLLFTTWNPHLVQNINLINLNVTAVLHENSLFKPGGLVFDELKNLYISNNFGTLLSRADSELNVITFAGSTDSGSTDGVGTNARFTMLRQMVFDSRGRLYITDQRINSIRMLTW